MEKIAVLVDSTSYLSEEKKNQLGIKTVYLNVIINNISYKETLEMTAESYNNYLQNQTNDLPTTSQPAIGDIVTIFQNLKNEGYTDVIAIALSSGISGTYSSYSVASLMVEGLNVHPFDSEVSCQPEGQYAIAAANLIKEGKSVKDIIAILNDMKKLSRAYFIADDLMHLKRGGRLNGAQALVGNLLQVKPILHFENKIIVPYQKIRTYKKAISKIYELFDEFYREHSNKKILAFAIHVGAEEKAIEISQHMKENYPDVDMEVSIIGPVISTHLGLGSVALGWTVVEY